MLVKSTKKTVTIFSILVLFVVAFLDKGCRRFIDNAFFRPNRTLDFSVEEVKQFFKDYGGVDFPFTNSLVYSKRNMHFWDRLASADNIVFSCSEEDFNAWIENIRRRQPGTFAKRNLVEYEVIVERLRGYFGQAGGMLPDKNAPVKCYMDSLGGQHLLICFLLNGIQSRCYISILWIQ